MQPCGSFAAKGDFGTVHAEYARVAAGSSHGSNHALARKESEFHQPPGDILREIEALQHPFFTRSQIFEAPASAPGWLPATQLHH
jgi:DnaJ-class molecular chaperone